MTIHSDHPFNPPAGERDPLRRFRGRLASPVSVWTSVDGGERAGLTVSSLLVADGDPGSVLGVLDPLSDLWEALQTSAVAVVNLLGWPDRQLAEVFGFVAPSPGGPFAAGDWILTEWGPALSTASAWAGCRLLGESVRPLGWGLLVELRIEHIDIGPDVSALMHRRGRYATIE